MQKVVKTTRKVKKTKREEILEAGIRLFARVPFTEMTIASVAREANCGHSLVYHYFRNINALYDEGVAHVANLFIPLIEALRTKDIPAELVFVGSIVLLVDNLKKDPMAAYYLSLISYNHSEAPRNEAVQAIQSRWRQTFTKIITEGQKNNGLIMIMSPDDIMRSIHIMIKGLVSAQIFDTNPTKPSFNAADLYLPFLKGAH